MISYNNIVARFEKFVENHKFLRQFSHGSPEDLDQGKEPEYPLLHLVLTGVNYPDRTTDSLGTSKTYSLNIFILSLPPDKIDKTSHQKEVISDSIQIAEDVIADVINGFNVFTDAGQYYTSAVSIEPLEEETKNVLAGVLLSLDLTVPYTWDACTLPLTGVDEPGVVDCAGATYQNSDGSFSTTIASGGTFTANDITVTDVDNTTRDVPANTDVTCEWKTITVDNTDGVEKISQATYPVGGAIELPDLNLRDGNGFSTDYPIPAEIVITGRPISSASYVSIGGNDILGISVQGCPTIFPISIENGNGGVLGTISSDPSGTFDLGQIGVFNNATDLGDFNRVTSNILVSTASDETVPGTVTVSQNNATLKIQVPDYPASGIIYKRPHWEGQETSYATGDAGWQQANGTYSYSDSGDACAELDFSATRPFFTLVENNAFGNKERFTDSTGAGPNFSGTTFPDDDAEWTSARPSAVPYYVIDHLTGLGWHTGGVSSTVNWATAVSNANGFSNSSYSDFRLPTVNEYLSVLYRPERWDQPNLNILWDSNDGGITLLRLWTSETSEATSTGNAYAFTNSNDLTRRSKTESSFNGYFLCRTHY